MTSMSYAFTKLMGSVLFEVFLNGEKKVLIEEVSNILLPKFLGEEKL